tara:strand:+ start:1010 stop:1696 length:687 start_codon:yes stop_codon:yes gene_type:complete
MPQPAPIYSYTFVTQSKTITYGYSIANLSCTLSANDVKINTPSQWGITQAKNDINVRTRDQDLSSENFPTWNNPGTSISIENINCPEDSIGTGNGQFFIENLGLEELKIYGVLLNNNGNMNQTIVGLTLSKGIQTLNSGDMMANGGVYSLMLDKNEYIVGSFDIITWDYDHDSSPDNNSPTPTLEIYSNDLNPSHPNTVVDDFEIGDEDLQSKWDINVTWTVTPFTTG